MSLKYYADTKDAPLFYLLRQNIIKTENQLMAFSGSSWQYFPDTGRSTGAYTIICRGGTIYHVTHVPGPFYQSSAESEYNAACTAGMDSSNFRMLTHELLNRDPDIVPEKAPLIILDKNSAVCIDNDGKYTRHTRHIYRRVHFVRNGEKCKIHKIECCEGGLKLADIATKNVCEDDLNTRMKYILVRLDN